LPNKKIVDAGLLVTSGIQQAFIALLLLSARSALAYLAHSMPKYIGGKYVFYHGGILSALSS